MSLELLTWYMFFVSYSELLEFSITSCRLVMETDKAASQSKAETEIKY